MLGSKTNKSLGYFEIRMDVQKREKQSITNKEDRRKKENKKKEKREKRKEKRERQHEQHEGKSCGVKGTWSSG